MLPLVWRATFIHCQVEDEDTCQLPFTRRPSRAATAPCVRVPVFDIFDHERSYVEGLAERISKSAAPSPPAATEVTPGREQRLGGAATRKLLSGEMEEEDEALEVSSQGSTVASRKFAVGGAGTESRPSVRSTERNVAVSKMLLRAKVAGKDGGALADELTREPSSGTVSLAFEPPALATAGMIAQPTFCNTGSIGHPALCSRPCLYFATNNCTNGAKCEFCHMEHNKRMPHLNKAHREQLRDMDASRAKALLIPLVREKALEVDRSARTEAAVEHLVRACGLASAERIRKSREEQSLGKVFKCMTVRLLLIILERSVLQNEPEAQASAEALLAHLRCTFLSASAPR